MAVGMLGSLKLWMASSAKAETASPPRRAPATPMVKRVAMVGQLACGVEGFWLSADACSVVAEWWRSGGCHLFLH